MDEKTLEDALKQAEILADKKREVVNTLEETKNQAKVWKKELYELKKKYDLAVKTIATLENVLGDSDVDTQADSVPETPVDDTEKEEVVNIPETDETPVEDDTEGDTEDKVEEKEEVETPEEEKATTKKPRSRAKKAPKKEVVEGTVGLTDDELDVDDVFGHDLDDEINNIEF